MVGDDTVRLNLKAELLQQVDKLGLQKAIFPSKEEEIDEIVRQLESLNPIPQPLSNDNLPKIFGDWELIYASRGTVITRPLASLPEIEGGIGIQRVWQTLSVSVSGERKINTTNAAIFELFLLGEWQLQADGVWSWEDDEQTAKVIFGTFSVQAAKLFGLSTWNLPTLKIPILEFLRNEALWTTSYLDEDIRIGRGATGNLFVFRR